MKRLYLTGAAFLLIIGVITTVSSINRTHPVDLLSANVEALAQSEEETWCKMHCDDANMYICKVLFNGSVVAECKHMKVKRP